MRLPDEVQKCVVFFGLKGKDPKDGLERIRYGGTGFFIRFPSGIEGANFVALVTAAHVAQKLEHGEFYIRANRKDGTAAEYRVDGGVDAIWHFHPTDKSVDAAVAIWAPPMGDDIDFLCIPSNMFLGPNKIGSKNIGTGDEVYITGLFRLLYGAKRNLPIVRTGSLAMLPTDRVPVRDWQTKDVLAYLVEARSIGGSSGSPVFVQRSIRVKAVEHSGREPVAAGAVFWLGLVLGHLDDRNVRAPDDWDSAIEVGITVVVPCYQVLEIFEGPRIKDEMEQRAYGLEVGFYEVIMEGSSPSSVPPEKQELAAAIMSAPALSEVASAYPSVDEITKPTAGFPSDDPKPGILEGDTDSAIGMGTRRSEDQT